jgi:hypothetical protein
MEYLLKLVSITKRNIIFSISATGALVLHLIIAWLPLDRLEGYFLLRGNGPLMDDSYIFFKISKDLAEWFAGFAPSFQLTTGVQPLIAFLYTPLFHLFWNSKELPIHFALSLNAILGFCANVLLYSLLRKIVSRSIATFLISIWIWSPYVMNQSVNGMETTLALLLLLVTLNYYWQINQVSINKSLPWLLLGVFLGIGFWTRVDLGLLGIAFVLDQAWRIIKDGCSARSLRVRNILVCSLTALAIAAPWMIYTFVSTGTIIPISGRAVHQITSIFLHHQHPNHPGFPFMIFGHFKDEFLTYLPLIVLSKHKLWQLFISALSLVGFILAVMNKQLRILLRPVWIFQILILVSYIVFIGGFWHLYRYFYPVYTLMLFLQAVTMLYVESKIKLKPWTINTLLFILFIPYAYSYTVQYYNNWSKDSPPRHLSAALFAKDRIPPKAKVGGFQSGSLSYWLDTPIINLDGVTNKAAYLHLKNKTMDAYLEEQDIDYLVEEVFLFGIFDKYLGGQLSKHYTLVNVKTDKRLRQGCERLAVYKRK